MSLAQKLRLELEDAEDVEVVYDGRDLRAWEIENRRSALVERMSVGMITWLGHHAAVRTGAINGELKDYKAFEAICVSVERLRQEGEKDPDPTTPENESSPQTAGDDSSAPSP